MAQKWEAGFTFAIESSHEEMVFELSGNDNFLIRNLIIMRFPRSVIPGHNSGMERCHVASPKY